MYHCPDFGFGVPGPFTIGFSLDPRGAVAFVGATLGATLGALAGLAGATEAGGVPVPDSEVMLNWD